MQVLSVDNEKGNINIKLKDLQAAKAVLDWKNNLPKKPTDEDYETQKRYYDGLWQQNQDSIVKGLSNNTLDVGTDEWRAIMTKGSDLRGQRDAYHMGKMGMLDGEKAQEATVGGYRGDMSFSSQNEQLVHAGAENQDINQNDLDELVRSYESKEDEPEEKKMTQRELDEINELIQADIDFNDNIVNAKKQAEQYFDEEFIANTDLGELRYWQIEARKQMEIDNALKELEKKLAEEISALDSLKEETYKRASDYYDKNPDKIEAIKGQIMYALGLYDLNEYAEAELKQAFAESEWMLDQASQVNREDILKDIEEKYDGMKQEAINAINEEFNPYEKVAELGLSDLWAIKNMSDENSGARKILEEILEPSNIDSLYGITINSLRVNDIYDTLELRMLDAKKYDEPKESLEKINLGLTKIISGPLDEVGIIISESKNITDAIDYYNKIKEEEVKKEEYIYPGNYIQYNIKGDSLNSLNEYRISIEVDKDGNFIEPPHIYVTKWHAAANGKMFYMHKPKYYEIK